MWCTSSIYGWGRSISGVENKCFIENMVEFAKCGGIWRFLKKVSEDLKVVQKQNKKDKRLQNVFEYTIFWNPNCRVY